MSQDPYPRDHSSGNRPYRYDGDPDGRQGGSEQYPDQYRRGGNEQYPPPHQQGGYGQYPDQHRYQPYRSGPYHSYQPGMYAPSAQTLEGERAAQLSLVLGIVGFFVAGLVLGPLAIWQARKAEGLGVPATAGKVLGWILTVLWGGLTLLMILAVVLLFATVGTAGTYWN